MMEGRDIVGALQGTRCGLKDGALLPDVEARGHPVDPDEHRVVEVDDAPLETPLGVMVGGPPEGAQLSLC